MTKLLIDEAVVQQALEFIENGYHGCIEVISTTTPTPPPAEPPFALLLRLERG